MTKILFVCSANVDRSPTAEHLYKRHPGLEVKSAGISDYARQPISAELLRWADVVLCMEEFQQRVIEGLFADIVSGKTIDFLDVPDDYRRMDPSLVDVITRKVDGWLRRYHKG